jgi:uncharacterized membrane protein YtjA (UPF0391 family)
MARLALIFLATAAIAALLGFTGMIGAASGVAQILFAAFFFLALALLIFNHSLPNN